LRDTINTTNSNPKTRTIESNRIKESVRVEQYLISLPPTLLLFPCCCCMCYFLFLTPPPPLALARLSRLTIYMRFFFRLVAVYYHHLTSLQLHRRYLPSSHLIDSKNNTTLRTLFLLLYLYLHTYLLSHDGCLSPHTPYTLTHILYRHISHPSFSRSQYYPYRARGMSLRKQLSTTSVILINHPISCFLGNICAVSVNRLSLDPRKCPGINKNKEIYTSSIHVASKSSIICDILVSTRREPRKPPANHSFMYASSPSRWPAHRVCPCHRSRRPMNGTCRSRL